MRLEMSTYLEMIHLSTHCLVLYNANKFLELNNACHRKYGLTWVLDQWNLNVYYDDNDNEAGKYSDPCTGWKVYLIHIDE